MLKYTITVALLLLVIPASASVNRTTDRDILMYFTDSNYSDTINITLTDTGNFSISSFTESIPSVFNVTLQSSTHILDNGTFTGLGNTVSYSLTLNVPITCATRYTINGTFIDVDLQSGETLQTTIYVIPVNQDTVIYSIWDANTNNKIDKPEMFIALMTWFQSNSITKPILFKIISKYFDQTSIVPKC